MTSRKSWRITGGMVTKEPFASRTHCAHGHRWSAATERWRERVLPSGGTTKERDCLVCKRASEARRRRENDRMHLIGRPRA